MYAKYIYVCMQMELVWWLVNPCVVHSCLLIYSQIRFIIDDEVRIYHVLLHETEALHGMVWLCMYLAFISLSTCGIISEQ